MNKMIKCLCGVVIALVCCVLPVTKAEAAADGSSMENAMEITLGKEYTLKWTASNCLQGKFYKIEVPEDGWINVWLYNARTDGTSRAPLAAQIYDSEKTLIWDYSRNDGFACAYDSTHWGRDNNDPNYFALGLRQGTYYIKVIYDRIYEKRLAATETAHSWMLVGYNQDSYWETENNNTKETADELELNMIYTGTYGDKTNDIDWFKVELEKDQTYYIRGSISSFITPDGADVASSLKRAPEKDGYYDWKYTSPVSGTYYIMKQHNGEDWRTDRPCISYETAVLTSERTPANDLTEGLVKASDGNTYYYNKGVDGHFTSWEEQDGKQWYVKEGRVTYETGLVVGYHGKYYIENGALCDKETLVFYEEKWLHVKDGTTTDFTGFVSYEGNMWYVKDGEVRLSTGLVFHQGKWWYIQKGVLNKTTTLVNCYGSWWYIKDGAVSFETTMVPFAGKQWYVKGGAVSFVTDFVYCDGKWWLVQNGAVSNISSLVPYKGKWWYVKDGAVSFENTLVSYGGKTWLVLNGTVQFATTMVPYEGKWWYIKDGAVSQETTLVQYNGRWWYVKDGVVDFSFTGEVPYNGKNWTVKNGTVVF